MVMSCKKREVARVEDARWDQCTGVYVGGQ